MRHPSLQRCIPLNSCVGAPSCPRTPGRWRERSPEMQFRELLATFQRTGGVASGNQVAGLVDEHWDQSISTVARWIVSRHVLSFMWQAQTLLPLFQFERPAMLLRPGIAEVVTELSGVYDDWDLALWFAAPNAWLDEGTPADLLATRSADVLDAARADRFIVRG